MDVLKADRSSDNPTERVMGHLTGLALSEHMGDVNDELPGLCKDLGLPEPVWSDELDRYVMAWEDEQW